MKLYTENEIKKFMQKNVILDELTLSLLTPIELPTDEEIDIEIQWLDNPLERLNFKAGIRWMRDKIRIQGR
jgi:hypothetical protein